MSTCKDRTQFRGEYVTYYVVHMKATLKVKIKYLFCFRMCIFLAGCVMFVLFYYFFNV